MTNPFDLTTSTSIIRRNQLMTWLEDLSKHKLMQIAEGDAVTFIALYEFQLGDIDESSLMGRALLNLLDNALHDHELEIRESQL